ncbi:3-hydroxyacyl-CoA dehydrogenase [Alkalihalophilus lindianensis]|uniref:3-hydroxyacyl-CoA dehydrogenase n=1 Tax=Alkalihalophilus lindianensis TaxID=1630542 RepID=A0ABU3X6X4_9BACI|nr:3-hydroxyacyl-CoA dehydrogenase [Alkalihalophilus lindianensis]MDV2683648.1 3-hydroxyacyl-CoA dehydrogenase [Alkalihalophilus lindianensis]
MRIKNKTFLVTGGSSGLGEATVRMIVKNGGNAVIVDVDEQKGTELINELGDQVSFIKTDVTNDANAKQAVEHAVTTFQAVHGLINCAGIGKAKKVVGKSGIHGIETFKKVMNVNLIGSFSMIQHVAEVMKDNEPNREGERGIIVNTASVAAFDGQIGQAAYAASKGGIVSMTLPLARELASHGIRVMSIAPGIFETPMFATLPDAARESLGKMTPFPNRLGQPTEYAQLVEQIMVNPMLNGEVIRLDGAIRMQMK